MQLSTAMHTQSPPSQVSSISSGGSALDQYHSQLTHQLDKYYDDTKLLVVIQEYIHELTYRFATSRLVPLNPFIGLLAHVRQAEQLSAGVGQSLANPLELVAFEPQEERKLLLENQIVTFNAPSPLALAVWGRRDVMQSIPYTEQLQQGVEAMYEQAAPWLREGETTDEGCSVTTVGALVGVGVLFAGELLMQQQEQAIQHVEVERHVIVSGPQLELAMNVFARHQIRTLFETTKQSKPKDTSTAVPSGGGGGGESMALVGACRIQISHATTASSPVTPESEWTIEKVNANRQAFLAAVKLALVASGKFVMEMLYQYEDHTSDCGSHDGDDVASTTSRFVRYQIHFFFHFQSVSSTTTSSTGGAVSTTRTNQPTETTSASLSFVSHSRFQESGICFANHSAFNLALRLQEEDEQDREHAKGTAATQATKPSSGSLTTITDNTMSSPLDEITRQLRSGTQSPTERRYWLGFLPSTIAYRLAKIVSCIDSLLYVICSVDASEPMTSSGSVTERLRFPLEMYQATMVQLVQDAAIDRSSSLLRGLVGILKEVCWLPQHVQSGYPGDDFLTELYERLQRSRELLAWLSGTSNRDFGSLVTRRTNGQAVASENTAPPPQMVDLRADIALAIDQRWFPPAIVAECVFGQYLVQSRLDTALERALVNSVACGLPPNPFIPLCGHLRESAIQLYLEQSVTSQPQPHQPVTVKKKKKMARLLDSGGFALDVDAPVSVLISANERLLNALHGTRVMALHAFLAAHQVYRSTAYHPSKASYSARIVASLILDDPTLTCQIQGDEMLLQFIEVMEHVIVEGNDASQALWFFADAVRRDVGRLTEQAEEGDVVLHLLGPQGDIVTTVELLDIQKFEQLMMEATPRQCLLRATLPPFVAVASPAQQQTGPLVQVVRKTYAFHHISTEQPSQTTKRHNSNCLSDMYKAKLWFFGVWADQEAAQIMLSSIGARPVQVHNVDTAAYTRRARERKDTLLLSYLQWYLGATEAAQASPPQQGGSSPPALLLHLLDMETALEWLMERIQSPPADAATPRERSAMVSNSAILCSIAGAVERHVLSLANAMGYVDSHRITDTIASIRALLRPIDGQAGEATAASIELMSRRLWLLVLVIRFANQADQTSIPSQNKVAL